MKDPTLFIYAALLIATLGMALIVLGTVHGAVFMPGVIILAVGLFGAGAATVWRTVRQDG